MSADLHDLLVRHVEGPTRHLDASDLVRRAKRGTRVRRVGGAMGLAAVAAAAALAITQVNQRIDILSPDIADQPDDGEDTPMSEIEEGGVFVLTKESEWREDPPRSLVEEEYMRLLEIAYDVDTGQRLWDDNGPQSTDTNDAGGSELPYEIDYSSQALVVWSAGESGSCPETLEGITTSESGVVVNLSQPGPEESCTEDFNRYRVVAVVNLDSVPGPEDVSDAIVEAPPRAEVLPYP